MYSEKPNNVLYQNANYILGDRTTSLDSSNISINNKFLS